MASILQPAVLNSYVAGGTISKGHAVKFDSTENQVVKCTAATDKAIGLAQGDASSGGLVEVVHLGGAKGLAGGVIAPGDMVAADGNGALVATTSGNDKVIGKSMSTTASGDIFNVLVIPSNY